MKKLSDINSLKTIVLFEDVLDGDKVLESQEIKRLSNAVLGGSDMILKKTKKEKVLHDWLRDELYRADVNERSMVYWVKTPFVNLVLEHYNKEYSGGLNVCLFKPTIETKHKILVLTCHWENELGLFRNDSSIIGVVADAKDLEHIETQL